MTLKSNRGPSLSPGNGSQLKCLNHVLSRTCIQTVAQHAAAAARRPTKY